MLSVEKEVQRTDAPLRVIHPDDAIKVALEPIAPFPQGWSRIEIQFPPEGVVDVLVQLCAKAGTQYWQRLAALDRNSFAATVRVGSDLSLIVLRISGSGDRMRPLKFSIRNVTAIAWVAEVAARARHALARHRFGVVRSAVNFAFTLRRPGMVGIPPAAASNDKQPYETWMRLFDEWPEKHRPWHEERLRSLKHKALISCVVTLTGADARDIGRLATSMVTQIYPRWELVIAAPEKLHYSIAGALRSKGLEQRSFRMISAKSDESSTLNALLAQATGTYVVRVPQGAVLRSNALLELAMTVALHPDAEVVYSDEDQIDESGRRLEPKFKPAWSPDFFVSYDYIGHLTLIRRKTASETAGWRAGLFASTEHDLKLRIADRVQPEKIIHLAKILVSCPATKNEHTLDRTGPERMVRDHLERCGLAADLVWPADVALPRLRYRVPVPSPTVSLIIPTRDRADLLEPCVQSILSLTRYGAIELLIIDNGSREAATRRLFSALKRERAIRILSSPGPFNYSALNNMAAHEARGTILGLLNNDIEVRNSDWLEEMVSLVVRPEVGCVGAKLLYPDGRVQHAGVYLGLGKLAAHGYRLAAANSPGQLNRMRTVQNVSAVTAACLLIRKSVFQEVGGLDEQELKVALSDLDFCLKVRAAGYFNLWTPFAELVHHESVSRGRDITRAKAKRLALEQNAVCARWGAALFSDPYYSPNLTDECEDFSVRVH